MKQNIPAFFSGCISEEQQSYNEWAAFIGTDENVTPPFRIIYIAAVMFIIAALCTLCFICFNKTF